MRRFVIPLLAVFIAAIVVTAGLWTYNPHELGDGSKPTDDGTPPSDIVVGGVWTPFNFTFSDPTYEASPLDYALPLVWDDVATLDRIDRLFDMSQEQRDFLRDNGILGIEHRWYEFESFSAAYESITEDHELPTFITSDSVMDAYHHVFEGILIELEQADLTERAKDMAGRLMAASHAQRTVLTPERSALAEQNVVYFAVALRILDPTAEVPDYAEGTVDGILAKVEAAEGLLDIPGFHQPEDFTQYKPRGHYTRTPELSAYFKAMMWFGRITFQGKYDDETQRAVLAASALRDDPEALGAYTGMSKVIDFMVGTPDDLTPVEVIETVDEVLGPLDATYSAVFDATKLDLLQAALEQLHPPRISSDAVLPGERVWGMRVFGQRYVPDSYIFQECVYSKVPTRFMPSCLDVFSVLGSEEAWDREDLAAHAPDLEQQLKALKEEFDGYPANVWNSTLYWSWLHTLRSLHEASEQPANPAFMQTRAWSAKELNAQAASWTQLTHDTILYRKQSYSELECEPQPSDIFYVEPVPELYSRLGDMVRATERGLRYLEMGSDLAFSKIELLGDTLETLERVAIAELEGKAPKGDDVTSLRRFYRTLDRLNDMGDDEEDTKTVLVSDVHTDPNPPARCLQEAVGYVRPIVVVVRTPDGLQATVGAVFEHYEFERYLEEGRLTDEEWTAMLEEGNAPEPAPWAQDFIL